MCRSALCVVLILSITAETCSVYTVYPLANASQSVLDTTITGTWSNGQASPNGQFTITADTGGLYSLLDLDDTTNHRLLRFTKIGGQLYVDETLNQTCQEHSLYCMDLHMIGRVEQLRPAYVVQPLSGAFLDRFVAASPTGLHYALFKDQWPHGYVLFDSTSSLRAFVLAHASDSGAFDYNTITLTYVGPVVPRH
jgi:hypothetical protein